MCGKIDERAAVCVGTVCLSEGLCAFHEGCDAKLFCWRQPLEPLFVYPERCLSLYCCPFYIYKLYYYVQ